MNLLSILLLFLSITIFNPSPGPTEKGKKIIQSSIQKYDPQGKFSTLKYQVHIQEPRPQTLDRYSKLRVDHATGYFKLDRNREDKIASYIVDAQGQPSVLLDGESSFPEEWREKYRLNSQAPFGYKRFYYIQFGLPMTLDDDFIEAINELTKTTFNGQAAYAIDITLKEPMFTNNWKLYIARKDFAYLGMDMYKVENDEVVGERLIYDGHFEVDGVTLPRMKHWYDIKTGAFLGSDIVVMVEGE
ncbi:MAG: DUF6503 family protein [Bacteroidota bacterium]